MTVPKSTRPTRLIDLTGQRFSRLTVLHRAPNKSYSQVAFWHCRCDCGAIRDVAGIKLTTGATKSCGCLRRERLPQLARTHGQSNAREYSAWCAAKARCYNPNNSHYHLYGGRGIQMRGVIRHDYLAFFRHMGPCPPGYSLDRIDTNGHYEIGNMRWADPFQQANNTRVNQNLTFNGLTLSMAAWDREIGAPEGLVKHRIYAGWSIERALTTPVRPIVRRQKSSRRSG